MLAVHSNKLWMSTIYLIDKMQVLVLKNTGYYRFFFSININQFINNNKNHIAIYSWNILISSQ